MSFGRRFDPTEEELVSYYLKNKITVGLNELESKVMIERDMYGVNATPWDLFRLEDDQLPWQFVLDEIGKFKASERVLYVFTVLSNVGKTGKSRNKHKNRVAGCGTWHGNTHSKPVKNLKGDRVIGYKRSLKFKSGQETVGQWTMYEYTIDAATHGINFNCEDYVLCKIKRDDSKSSKEGKLVSCKRKFTSPMLDKGVQIEPLAKKYKPNFDNQGYSSAAAAPLVAAVDVSDSNVMCSFGENQEHMINNEPTPLAPTATVDVNRNNDEMDCFVEYLEEEIMMNNNESVPALVAEEDFTGANSRKEEPKNDDQIGGTSGGYETLPQLVDFDEYSHGGRAPTTEDFAANFYLEEDIMLNPNLCFNMDVLLNDLSNNKW